MAVCLSKPCLETSDTAEEPGVLDGSVGYPAHSIYLVGASARGDVRVSGGLQLRSAQQPSGK
jgi:hypothetical protein